MKMFYSGKFIGDVRNTQNIKLAELAQGLCSTAQLARIRICCCIDEGRYSDAREQIAAYRKATKITYICSIFALQSVS